MTESITSDALAWSATHAPLHIRAVSYQHDEDWCCVCFGGTSDLSVVPDEEDADTLFSGSVALRDILGVTVEDGKTPVLIVVRQPVLALLLRLPRGGGVNAVDSCRGLMVPHLG